MKFAQNTKRDVGVPTDTDSITAASLAALTAADMDQLEECFNVIETEKQRR